MQNFRILKCFKWWSVCVHVWVCMRAHVCVCMSVRVCARVCVHARMDAHVFWTLLMCLRVYISGRSRGRQVGRECEWDFYTWHMYLFYIYGYFKCTFLSPCVKGKFTFLCFVYWWIIKIDLVWLTLVSPFWFLFLCFFLCFFFFLSFPFSMLNFLFQIST